MLRSRARLLVAGLLWFGTTAYAIDCSTLPTQFTGNEFPTGDFFSNFDNSCYTIPFGTGHGGTAGSDLNSVYFKTYFKVDPRYQLIIVATFPNSRYFSVTAYDDHSAIADSISDTNIVPLTSQYINPYQPGNTYVAGQRYAVPINFGGVPGNLETGCMMNGYNVDVNGLDATVRHQGMNWNNDPNVFRKFPGFPLHIVDTPEHTNPNSAGTLMIRSYLDMTPSQYSPYVIVRDVASGCAYPGWYVMQTLGIITHNASVGSLWLDSVQAQAHETYDLKYLPQFCYAVDKTNMASWARQPEYVALINPDSSYTNASLPAGLAITLASAGELMRIRFRVPTTPPTPCQSGCSRTGSEELRYFSLSFEGAQSMTLASLADNAFTQDPNGYVTLIVGTGTPIPAWVTPANGYTVLDLTTTAGYQQLSWLFLRNIIPAANFNCSGTYVPYNTGEHTPAGGLMGEYLPVLDYPLATSLPQTAAPLVQTDSCGIFPNGQPGAQPNCRVVTSPPPAITNVTTQCANTACDTVVAQPQPPLTVTGSGFGIFPNGLPFVGNSAYLEIIDWTQNWSAGFSGDTCTVNIDYWTPVMITLAMKGTQDAGCAVQSGDQLSVTIWNPQSKIVATDVLNVLGQ
jgi:hypothetical protein